MSDISSEREKRERESPEVTSPLCKQAKMADGNSESRKCDSPLPCNMTEKKMDKVMEIISSLKKGQESLKKTFDRKSKSFEKIFCLQQMIR